VVSGKSFSLNICTNGKQISNDILDLLNVTNRKTKLFVRLSLDSHVESHHDKNRGSGSFNQVVDTIKILRKHGIELAVKKVISRDDYENDFQLDTFISFCKKLDIQSVLIGRLIASGLAEKERLLTTDQTEYFRQKIITNPEFMSYLISEDFLPFRENSTCSNLTGDDKGFVVSNKYASPCSGLTNINIGGYYDFQNIYHSKLSLFSEIRKSIIRRTPESSVFSCPECIEKVNRYMNSNLLEL